MPGEARQDYNPEMDTNPCEAPREINAVSDTPATPAEPPNGILIEKFIAVAIVSTLLVALLAVLPQLLN